MNSESRTKRSIKNVITGFGLKIIGLIFPFIIKTVIIKELGISYLGLNSLFTSVLMMLSLSELGIGSALVFNMYKPIANGEKEKVCALLKAYRDIYRIIGIVISVIGILLIPFLPLLIKGGYPKDINIYVLYLIYLFNTVISYLMFAYKKSLWEASQLNGYNNILEMITTFFMYIMQIIVLILFKNYYIYIIFLPLSTLALNLLRSYFVDKNFPEYKCYGKLEKGFIKSLYLKVKALLGHKIGSTVITGADSIVISSMLGLETLAIYSNYYQIINALIGVVTIFYTSITASIGNLLVNANKHEKMKNFNTLTFINNWIVGWFSICLLCLFQPFMKIWMGKDLMFSFDIVILFVIYFYAWLFRRIGLTYKDAAGMWEEDFWKPYIGIVVNIVANIVLCHYIGVAGALISTIIIMLFIYFPWETKVIFEKIFEQKTKRYYMKMIQYALVTIVFGVITYIVCNFIDVFYLHDITILLVKAFICVILPNILFAIIYHNTEEFKDTKKRVCSIISKRKKVI